MLSFNGKRETTQCCASFWVFKHCPVRDLKTDWTSNSAPTTRSNATTQSSHPVLSYLSTPYPINIARSSQSILVLNVDDVFLLLLTVVLILVLLVISPPSPISLPVVLAVVA
jgi:hypothetical protein